VLVGINLLREGLDLPEVSLVAILDADKEGYLRSETSLVQTIGRAARHERGHVIMYADTITGSMKHAIDETYRRRGIQQAYNEAHGIEPASIRKSVRELTDRVRRVAEESPEYNPGPHQSGLARDEAARLAIQLENEMKQAAKALEFEKAALIRDQIVSLRREIVGDDPEGLARIAELVAGTRRRRGAEPLVTPETTNARNHAPKLGGRGGYARSRRQR
jgi:excinuclease ABC subunit B